jgi:hypothetical protein
MTVRKRALTICRRLRAGRNVLIYRSPVLTRRHAPLPSSSGPGKHDLGLGSPAVPVWLIAPCSRYGLGGVAAGAAGCVNL